MEYTSIFIHSEWTDICIYNINNFIKRKNIENEIGKYKIIKDEFIINWDNWDGDDIFVKIVDYYIQKSFYDNFMKNYNLLEIYLFNNNNIDIYVLNTDKNIIFKKNNLKIIGKYIIYDNYILITLSDNIEKKYIQFDNIYYENSYVKIENFKKINNNYYYNKIYETNELYEYTIMNLDIHNNKINKRLNKLLENKIFLNKNYLNKNNIENHINQDINQNIDENIFDNIIKLKLYFKIEVKKQKRILSLVEWGYPPFGGGENWILNMNKIFMKYNFETFLICFSDPFKNEYYSTTKLIDLGYVKVIQTNYEIINVIKLIKKIDPDIINHQGVNRLKFMKLSNILNIPFLTGFCFWQDIIKFNMDNINVNMLENNNFEKTDDFEFIINHSYSYVSSNFVNDIIFKLYHKKLDVIETISLEEEFKVDYINNINFDNKKYVTLINCHYNKGGYLIKYLCNELDNNIPLLFVYTENDPSISLDFLKNIVDERNKINNVNILYSSKTDIKEIYNKTRIILLPSLCDETFCRVGYESLINKIPIISTKNGNLKYLLNNYSIFVDDFDVSEWKKQIETLYYDKYRIIHFSKTDIEYTKINIIEEHIIHKINSIHESKYKLSDKNIGLIVPWADQGLGIQSRDYYITLKKIGYYPFVYSFKPYHSTHNNIYLQSDRNEWLYDNIMYSNNYRENLNYDELVDFVYKYNIKKIIIIEATFLNIFNIAVFLKTLNIKIYLVVNIECIRLVELSYHNIFDNILTNNMCSYLIMHQLFKYKTKYLGFHLNHPYFNNIEKNIKHNIDNLSFFCIGGLNSLSRKNIDIIITSFYKIYIENKYLNWILNVYIQGVEIPNIFNNYKCPNIHYFINDLSYKDIIHKYIENDIFIHMGSHEGLGLGFYESLYCGTPIFTMNWTPNNEIINDNINGWLLDCDFSNIYDNNNSFINQGIINEDSICKKIIEILNNNNTINIINNTIKNKNIYIHNNQIKFEKNLYDILSNI